MQRACFILSRTLVRTLGLNSWSQTQKIGTYYSFIDTIYIKVQAHEARKQTDIDVERDHTLRH